MAILGASGYTGAELVGETRMGQGVPVRGQQVDVACTRSCCAVAGQTRILLQHPYASITVMTADKSAGQPFSDVYPQYAYIKVRGPVSSQA